MCTCGNALGREALYTVYREHNNVKTIKKAPIRRKHTQKDAILANFLIIFFF